MDSLFLMRAPASSTTYVLTFLPGSATPADSPLEIVPRNSGLSMTSMASTRSSPAGEAPSERRRRAYQRAFIDASEVPDSLCEEESCSTDGDALTTCRNLQCIPLEHFPVRANSLHSLPASGPPRGTGEVPLSVSLEDPAEEEGYESLFAVSSSVSFLCANLHLSPLMHLPLLNAQHP